MKLFEGRTNRLTYWVSLAIVAVMTAALRFFLYTDRSIPDLMLMIIVVPRLHDIGRSAWLVLWGLAVYIVVAVLSLALLPPNMAWAGTAAPALAVFGLLVWLGCIPGDLWANRFGSPPPPGFGGIGKPQR